MVGEVVVEGGPTVAPAATDAAAADPLAPPPRRWIGRAVLALEILGGVSVLAWGLYLNFFKLGMANDHPDEIAYFDAGWAYVHGAFTVNLEHPLTAKLIMGAAQAQWGHLVVDDRVVAASASIVTGLVLWWWLRVEVGRAAGLAAAALWMLLPRAIGPFPLRVDRYGLLEPFMMLFGVVAMACCRWWCRSGRTLPAALCGLALGLAMTSKVPIAVIAPVLLAAPLITRWGRRTLLQGAAFATAVVLVVIGTYLPTGNAWATIRGMVAFQLRHDDGGHLALVAGHITSSPPWWTNLYWMVQGIGPWATAALTIGLLVLLLSRLRPIGLTVFVAACLGALLIFLLAISRVALEHYYYAFVPGFTMLAAIGIGRAFTRSAASARWARVGLRSVAVAALAAGAVSAVGLTGQTADLQPWGAQLAAEVIAREHVPPGPIVVTGIKDRFYEPYLPGASTHYDPLAVAIVVSRGDPLERPTPHILRMLHTHPGEFRHLAVNPELDLWIRIAPDPSRACTARVQPPPTLENTRPSVAGCPGSRRKLRNVPSQSKPALPSTRRDGTLSGATHASTRTTSRCSSAHSVTRRTAEAARCRPRASGIRPSRSSFCAWHRRSAPEPSKRQRSASCP